MRILLRQQNINDSKQSNGKAKRLNHAVLFLPTIVGSEAAPTGLAWQSLSRLAIGKEEDDEQVVVEAQKQAEEEDERTRAHKEQITRKEEG